MNMEIRGPYEFLLYLSPDPNLPFEVARALHYQGCLLRWPQSQAAAEAAEAARVYVLALLVVARLHAVGLCTTRRAVEVRLAALLLRVGAVVVVLLLLGFNN